MRKQILTLVACVAALAMQAQTHVVVQNKGGDTISVVEWNDFKGMEVLPAEDDASIVRINATEQHWDIPFAEFGKMSYFTQQLDNANDGYGRLIKPVDLGLSVYWSSADYGKETTYGFSFQPAPFSTEFPYRVDEAGNLSAPYDVVHKTWGQRWRMPTLAEWNELFAKCDVQKVGDYYSGYVKVTGATGESISLNLREYWTATAMPGSTEDGLMLNLAAIGDSCRIEDIVTASEASGFSSYKYIRPVADKEGEGWMATKGYETSPIGRTFETKDGLRYMALSETAAAVVDGSHCQGEVIMPDEVEFQGLKLRVKTIGPVKYGLVDAKGFSLFKGAPVTKVRFASDISVIPVETFTGCDQLTEVVLPAALTNIQDFSVLGRCPELKRVVCTGMVPPVVGETPLVVTNTGEVTDMYANFISQFRQRGGTFSYPTEAAAAYEGVLPWALFQADVDAETEYEVHLKPILGEERVVKVRNGMTFSHTLPYAYKKQVQKLVISNVASGEVYHILPTAYYQMQLYRNGLPVEGKEVTSSLGTASSFILLPQKGVKDLHEGGKEALASVTSVLFREGASPISMMAGLENADNAQIYSYILRNGYNASTSEPDYFGAYWAAYLPSPVLTHLVLTDEALAQGVPDPMSYKSRTPRIAEYSVRTSSGSLPVNARLYNYNFENGEKGRSLTGSNAQLQQKAMIAMLNQLMAEHTIVGDLNSGNEYFRTLGGTFVRYKDGKLQGTHDMALEAGEASPYGQPTNANVVEHKEALGHKWMVIDHALTAHPMGAYDMLQQLPECSDFLEMCTNLIDEVTEALEQDETYQGATDAVKKELLNAYLFFSTVEYASSEYSLTPIKADSYTLFVPNNEAMARERAAGRLDTWQQRAAFARYHLCYGSEVADVLPFPTQLHATPLLLEKKGYAPQQLHVGSTGNGQLSVTDATGATHQVVRANLFTYGVVCDYNVINATLNNVTPKIFRPGVIHVIDSALHYEQ